MWSQNSKRICNRAIAVGLSLLSVVSASAVAAQSCLPMGPGDVYRIVKQAEEPFLIFEGQVSFDESLLPGAGQGAASARAKPVSIPARFEGLLLGPRYFDQRVEGEMVLETHCTAEGCGTLTSGNRYLFFARQLEERGVVAVLDPCSSFFFDAIGGRPGDIILQCHAGVDCPSELPESLDDVTAGAPAQN